MLFRRLRAALERDEVVTIMALLLVEVAATIGTFLLIPQRTPVTHPPSPSFELNFYDLSEKFNPLTLIDLDYGSKVSNNERELTVRLKTSTDPAPTTTNFRIRAPDGRTFAEFKKVNWKAGKATVGLPASWHVDPGQSAILRLRIPSSWSFISNGRELSGVTPFVGYEVDPTTGTEPPPRDLPEPLPGVVRQTLQVTVHFDIRDVGDYDLTGIPSVPSGSDSLTFRALGNDAGPTVFTGSRSGAVDQDDRHTFYAGALIGIAGGAVTSAIPEGLKLARKRPSEQPAETSQPMPF